MGVAAKRRAQAKAEASHKPDEMIFVKGGTFRMGSDKHYPEEAPAHNVTVGSFFIDPTPVTNAQFRKFVDATGHVTFAEIPPDPKDYPGALPHMLKAGSLVFTPPEGRGRPARLEPMVELSPSAPIGEDLTDPAARSTASTIIPSSMSPSRMPRPTRNGRARNCRPKPNGNMPRAEVSTGGVRLGR